MNPIYKLRFNPSIFNPEQTYCNDFIIDVKNNCLCVIDNYISTRNYSEGYSASIKVKPYNAEAFVSGHLHWTVSSKELQIYDENMINIF